MFAQTLEVAPRTSLAALRQIREARDLVSRLTPVLRDAGLSLEAFLALTALEAANPQGLSMSELARSTGATPPTLTRHIDNLATRSMVYREIDVRDRRSTLIHVSKIGQAVIAELEERITLGG